MNVWINLVKKFKLGYGERKYVNTNQSSCTSSKRILPSNGKLFFMVINFNIMKVKVRECSRNNKTWKWSHTNVSTIFSVNINSTKGQNSILEIGNNIAALEYFSSK